MMILVGFVGFFVLFIWAIMYPKKPESASHTSTVFPNCMAAAILVTGFTIVLMFICNEAGHFQRNCFMRALVAVYFCCCFSLIAILVFTYHTVHNNRLSLIVFLCYVWVWCIPYVATIGHHNSGGVFLDHSHFHSLFRRVSNIQVRDGCSSTGCRCL
ncbi:uncharacterized protein [Rutidosis leptorrhynchoides]|uniref:uncharacterized protein n=1 Tax=Rutidosis leptorrhynchoides TaxID=125765 RepID=UPI003A98DC44